MRRLLLPCLTLLLAACTATEQATETAAPSVPTSVNSDADRRAIYESDGGRTSPGTRPDATPRRLGDQAAGSSDRQRIGTLGTDDPNTATPETRLQRLDNDPVPLVPPATTRQPNPPATR